jgi:hypothetical protein
MIGKMVEDALPDYSTDELSFWIGKSRVGEINVYSI